MPAKTSPDPKNTSVNNTAEAKTNTDRRAFMVGAAGAGADADALLDHPKDVDDDTFLAGKGTVRFVRRPGFICSGMVGTPGLEPGRLIQPTDFKSVVFTNFTMPHGTAFIQEFSYLMQRLASNDNLLSVCLAQSLSPGPRSARTTDQTGARRPGLLFPAAAEPAHNQLVCRAVLKTAVLPLPQKIQQFVWPQYKQTCGLPV